MELNNIIIFDGVCNHCDATVQFIINIDKKAVFKFLPLQSDQAKEIVKQFNLNSEIQDTVILIDNNRVYFKSDAVLRIFYKFKYPWKIFYFIRFIPKFIRDRIYELIAANRYDWFGKRNKCMIPDPEIKSRFLL